MYALRATTVFLVATRPGDAESELLRQYLDDIGTYPLLNADDERRLAALILASRVAQERLDFDPAPKGRERTDLMRTLHAGDDARGFCLAAHTFQQPGLAAIGDEKAVVVAESGARVSGITSLPVAREEFAYQVGSSDGSRCTLERESQQIHAGQTVGRQFAACKHRLVADGDAVLVGTHFCTPHPVGPAYDQRMRACHLGNARPGALHCALRRMFARGNPLESLRLVRVPVAVFGEDHAAGTQHHEGIAHTAPTPMPWYGNHTPTPGAPHRRKGRDNLPSVVPSRSEEMP